ncbi:pyrroline-5-carboxylate reductase, partial [Rhizobiaceae bacterium]|nr:pyrroline-5-carboxylate reductase [Rhizobiaceae bacterium]
MRVALIGAGNMGGAMLRGWIAGGVDGLQVVDPNIADNLKAEVEASGVTVLADIGALQACDIIILAVKPQGIGPVLEALAAVRKDGFAIISVAAGISQTRLSEHFAEGLAVVRAMPNTPALVGRGVTVCHGNHGVDAALRDAVTKLLSAIGSVEWIEYEAQMDAVTGLSGSGPAYVYRMAEAMAQAGVELGLEPALAMRLARATVSGAGEMLHASPEEAATLR